jgi:hypothetical protein
MNNFNKARGCNAEVKREQIKHMKVQSAKENQRATKLKDGDQAHITSPTNETSRRQTKETL